MSLKSGVLRFTVTVLPFDRGAKDQYLLLRPRPTNISISSLVASGVGEGLLTDFTVSLSGLTDYHLRHEHSNRQAHMYQTAA